MTTSSKKINFNRATKVSPFLNKNLLPEDLKGMSFEELNMLSSEIREELISVVSKHGGHIGPNLGVVELTVALLKFYSPPSDKIIWDVGHQTYVYKMLTGRREFLKATLRQADGCCGFTNREESKYDSFGSGHAGNAISAALGMAAARDLQKTSEKLIAIVGDGALGCGISLEALNNIADVTKDFILIVNDNEMSIDPNVGALSKHLDRIIASTAGVSLPRGKRRSRSYSIKSLLCKVKSLFSKKQPNESFFEHLGVAYIGPVDGHDIEKLVSTFEYANKIKGPVVIHVLTQKGLGYEPAKNDPELFHGLGSFDPKTGKPFLKKDSLASFSAIFGDKIEALANENEKIVAITAGMCLGTGLSKFRKSFPNRLFDVGIAEEHAVIYAAGMATQGIRPVVSLYGTFAQRAFDCVYHDVCLQNLPVVFTMDRAGFVPDGPTHHGIYDLAWWLNIPNINVLQPANKWELEQMLELALQLNSPTVIRYPKSECPIWKSKELVSIGKATIVKSMGTDAYLWAVGGEIEVALKIMEILGKSNIKITVVNPRSLKPFDKTLFTEQLIDAPIITLEDHSISGGFASIADRISNEVQSDNRCYHFGWPDEVIPWGNSKDIRKQYGLLAEQVASKLIDTMFKGYINE